MSNDLLNTNLNSITDFMAAAGALGTAAFGLVDASKCFGGGASNAGFSFIKRELAPFNKPLDSVGEGAPWKTLRANWLNGVPKADQKATAKSLIRLSLKPENAEELAKATSLDAGRLAAIATSISTGSPLSTEDMNLLGRFDAVISAILDAAYERGDQQYRNTAKATAALVATILAVIAGGIIFYSIEKTPSVTSYLSSSFFLLAALVGLISTPLAPVAKDVTSSLQAAVKAVNAARR